MANNLYIYRANIRIKKKKTVGWHEETYPFD